MLVLENSCPRCHGHLILDEAEGSLVCENCEYRDVAKRKADILLAREQAVEYGPKEQRYEPTPTGRLFLTPTSPVAEFLRETLEEATRGLDLEEAEVAMLRKYGLIQKEKSNGAEGAGASH